MTVKAYLQDPVLRGQVTILAVLDGDRPMIRTDRTWFHPQGGGQKADRGTIGGIEVYNVRHADNGQVDHFVSSLGDLVVGKTYEFLIDSDWRRMNARFHSAGHLVAAVAEARFADVVAINGHHWPGEARVEFKGGGADAIVAGLDVLQRYVDEAIEQGLPIHVVGEPFSDRRVQIGAFPALPCGGTHVSLTCELGVVRLRAAKLKSDVLRLGYEVLSTC